MALANLKAIMKQPVLEDEDEMPNPKPGLLKKKFGARPSKSTEVQPVKGLVAQLTGRRK